MLSLKRLFESLMQGLVSIESSISKPGTSSYFRLVCLRLMGVKAKYPVWVAQDTWFLNPKFLTLGTRVCIGESSKIVCDAAVTIGDDFVSSCGLYINTGNHDVDTFQPIPKPIKIGSRVWCGMRVTICSGVTIGDDVVIGAGSVVTRSIPSGYLAYGVPAKPIRKLERDDPQAIWSPLKQPGLYTRLLNKLHLSELQK
jgi:acetyltransferase-like isoleucine patch superfamily enzyme